MLSVLPIQHFSDGGISTSGLLVILGVAVALCVVLPGAVAGFAGAAVSRSRGRTRYSGDAYVGLIVGLLAGPANALLLTQSGYLLEAMGFPHDTIGWHILAVPVVVVLVAAITGVTVARLRVPADAVVKRAYYRK